MKLALSVLSFVSLVVVLPALGADTVLVQDGDFANVAPPQTTYVAGSMTLSDSTAATWYLGAEAQYTATGGNPGAWLQSVQWSDNKMMIGIAAPTANETWKIDFDSILQDAYSYSHFAAYGMKPGDTTEWWAGAAMGGTELLYDEYGVDPNWTHKSVTLDVPGDQGYSDILLVWSPSGDVLGTLRGIDNVLVTKLAPPHPGDANLDGKVSVGDLGILAANYGATGLDLATSWSKGDFNGDGNVSVGDLGILAANYGFGTIPEPVTMSLLGLGALALLRRRA